MRDFRECQAFVDHLRSEHQQIHQAVVNVERELRAADPPCDPNRVRTCLQRLRDVLAQHFAEEEEGGCLEQAISCAPRLSQEVADIEKEHATILKLVDRLIKRSADCHTLDFAEAFRRFASILDAHDAAEDRILQLAFGTGEFEPNESSSTAENER